MTLAAIVNNAVVELKHKGNAALSTGVAASGAAALSYLSYLGAHEYFTSPEAIQHYGDRADPALPILAAAAVGAAGAKVTYNVFKKFW